MSEENKNTNTEENELEKYKRQAQEYLDGWKRAKADYLNLKKEMEAQNKEIKEWMSKIMLLPLLDIMDSFYKAFDKITENIKTDSWARGVEGIKKQLEDYLKTQKVEVMAVKGEKFDPARHEAVESVEGGKSQIVAEELQRGYLVNGEVLRPAKVKIYK